MTAQEDGDLDLSGDPGQLAFQLYAALELVNYLSTPFRDDALVGRGREAVRSTIAAAAVDDRDPRVPVSRLIVRKIGTNLPPPPSTRTPPVWFAGM